MTLPNVLDRLFDGAVVVTPGDRPEVVLGVLIAHQSASFPQISGIVLNGGLALPEQVDRLLDGLEATLPIIATDLGTHATSATLTNRRGRLDQDSPRKIATALTLFAEHVDGEELLDRPRRGPHHGRHAADVRAQAPRRRDRRPPQHIVLPEGEEERILRAADILLRRDVADLTLLGDPIDRPGEGRPASASTSRARACSARTTRSCASGSRRSTTSGARTRASTSRRPATSCVDVSYFGTMMVELGLADGMVSGAVHTTAHTIRPALEVIRTVPGVSVVSSVFFMCLERPGARLRRLRGQPRPDRRAARRHRDLVGRAPPPRSGSSRGSRCCRTPPAPPAAGTDVEKVTAATALVRERAPDLLVEGPIQYDAAIDAAVARTKLPDSAVAGRATVFVFPDLNTGNNTYKAVQRSAGAVAVGPVLQGLRKPVNDLSRGATGPRHRQHRGDHRHPGRSGAPRDGARCWSSTPGRRR